MESFADIVGNKKSPGAKKCALCGMACRGSRMPDGRPVHPGKCYEALKSRDEREAIERIGVDQGCPQDAGLAA